jgi:type II secretory pathway pseudopilin PulG
MANSTSATCFLVVVMAIIVCLSMLVGIKGFSRQGDNQLLQDAEMYARTFSEALKTS